MNAREDGLSVRRIVLALDPSADVAGPLRAAADLAARLKAELSALFVEDENLFRSAELPFVFRMHASAMRWEQFDRPAMEQQLKRLEARARRLIEAEAGRREVAWSFEIVRGGAGRDVMSAAAAADLLVLGGPAPGRAGAAPPESRLRAAERARGPMLLLGSHARLARFFAVVYDGSPAADKALGAARQLVGDGALAVLVLGESGVDMDKTAARARKRLGEKDGAARYLPMRKADLSRICDLAGSFGDDSVLVLPADLGALKTEAGAAALDRVRCPILFVR